MKRRHLPSIRAGMRANQIFSELAHKCTLKEISSTFFVDRLSISQFDFLFLRVI